MTSSTLLGLQYEIYAAGNDGGADTVRFVADDSENVPRRNHAGSGGDDVSQQGLASDFMQNFGKL
jgi:hypothetical protein